MIAFTEPLPLNGIERLLKRVKRKLGFLAFVSSGHRRVDASDELGRLAKRFRVFESELTNFDAPSAGAR